MNRFDERYVGFGWNKISHVRALAAANIRFVVAPGVFIVHLPHAPSTALVSYRNEAGYKACIERLSRGDMSVAPAGKSRNAVSIPQSGAVGGLNIRPVLRRRTRP